MTLTGDDLFDLACRYAEAAAHAEAWRVHATLDPAPAGRAQSQRCRDTWYSRRDHARADLHAALSLWMPYPQRHTDTSGQPARHRGPQATDLAGLRAHHKPHTLDVGPLAGALAAVEPIDPVCTAVLTHLNLRVYPGDPHRADRTNYALVDLHGVSVGLQRRAADLYVHIDTAATGDRLLAVDINGAVTDHAAR